jgi:plastocyanin
MNDRSDRLIRGSRWLALVTMMAAGPAALTGSGPRQQANKTVIVRMRDDMRFFPESVAIAPGDTIVWINEGAMPHTATDKPGTAALDEHNVLPPAAEPFDSGLLQSGERFQHVFTAAGDYAYLCFLHEGLGMVGHVKVGSGLGM